MKNSSNPQNAESTTPGNHAQLHPAFRILVVDDDAMLLKLNATWLGRFGHEIETAEDGAVAWHALQVRAYDLLTTNYEMPVISGLELVKKVRSARMALPVILASGALRSQEVERHAWLQPLATLAKPFACDQLLATVNQILAPPKT